MAEFKKIAKYVIAVVAGKGGVGKSAVTVNLALSLQRKGYFVGILDADLYGPSLQKMLPFEEPIKESFQENASLLPAVGKGIKLMSMAYFRGEYEASIMRAPIANSVITQFMKSVDWGELDYLFLDFPPGTGDIQLTILQNIALSGGIVVTTPQEVALLDVEKARQMMEKMQVPVIGVVENMSYFVDPVSFEKHFVFGKEGGVHFASQNGIPFLGQIPVDANLSYCLDKGLSIFEKYPESQAAQSYGEIAEKMQEHLLAMQTHAEKALQSFEIHWQEM